MDKPNRPLRYNNYEDKITKPKLSTKSFGAIIATILVAVTLIVAAIYIFKSMNAENNKNEEHGIAWAGEDSPLVGIQFLTKNGLGLEQYSDLYNKLTKYFTEQHPEYKYVEYVNDSFYTFYESGEEAAADCIIEDTIEYEEDEIGFWNCTEDELAAEILSFILSSDDGHRYKVEIEQDHAVNEVNVHLYDSENQELI